MSKGFLRSRMTRGLGLIEALFGIALMSLVFWGLFGAFQLSILLVASSKSKAGAIALANERIEFARSLSYSNVGTIAGIPPGVIPQTEEVKLNETTYTRRTFIQYVDDPRDGIGASDATGITADYKVVKVELTWDIKGSPRSYALVTNIVPKGIESLSGGGTLYITVLDAYGVPVNGASVQVVNNTTDPAIDVTTFTSGNGVVIFPGSPAASGYQITVNKTNYSTAETYSATASNPNPNPGHLSVTAGNTTSATFAIDRVSSKQVRTFEPIKTESFTDSFTTETLIASLASTTLSGGNIELLTSGGSYESVGHVISSTTAPTYLYRWRELTFDDTAPASTTVRYHLYYESSPGVFTLLPDAALSGNLAGFSNSPVSLTSVSTTTYTALRIRADLETEDISKTPLVAEWGLTYDRFPIPVPNVAFGMRGNKTIGSNASAQPIYKYDETHNTGASASTTISDLEWDTYNITINGAVEGWDVADACAPQPFSLPPGVNVVTDLYLVPHTTHSLLVVVTDALGVVIPNASVTISAGASNETLSSSSCGHTFFSSPAPSSSVGNYTVQVSKTGFQAGTITNVVVQGQTQVNVVLNQN